MPPTADGRRSARSTAATRAVARTIGMDLPGWGRAALGPRA
jgi:hypothetical protein